ncbi:TetR family transcriptional regulator [Caballeronia megalochromosomata]|jgi:TetR/AcrR family transcriptional regulator, transcriptional repressor for nem operon|nr:TetR family transcriptional regulator [Caballeronia megalochromosomata]
MPRVSREQAELNRERIIQTAVRRFKIGGFSDVSVHDIMQDAGLTHGGFYGHFDSKDDLAAIACTAAFDQSVDRWKALVDGATDERAFFVSLYDYYLSAKQRDDVGSGCPAVALATDASREAKEQPARQVYTSGIKTMLGLLQTFVRGRKTQKSRDKALVQLSTMVGAVTLARAMTDDKLSEELLEAARRHLKTHPFDD